MKPNRVAARSRKAFALVLTLGLVLALGSCGRGPAAGTPGILRAQLENGLRVVIVPNALAPVATTVVNYLVGSNETPPGFPGMAHAQEHMMFRGSPGLSADQLADIAAAMGGAFDADTQQTVTQYFFTVPAEDLDVALHIEAIRMKGVLDTQDLWDKERGAIEQEVSRDLSNPTYVFYTQLLAALFKGTAYAHDALGTTASFNETTGAMLREFHDAWYAPNNAILVVVGNVQPEAVMREVQRLFGSIPAKELPARPAIALEPVQPESLALTTDLPYGLALVCFRLPGYRSPDHAAVRVMADVLSSQRGDLYALVPEGQALAAGFSMNALPEAGLGFAYAAYPAGGDGKALVEKIREILAETVTKGVEPDLVAAAKRHELTDSQFRRNSIMGLAMDWSEALAVKGLESPEQGTQAVEKVTAEEVDEAARKYLVSGQAITAVLTPQPSGKPLSAKGFGGPESFTPAKTEAVELPEWARTALARLHVPASVVNPTVSTLPNGLTLIVQPESISDTISVYGRIKSDPDLETPKGQEGVDRVLDTLFDYGTTSLDRLAFQKALDDIGASVSAGSEFSLQVLPGQFDRGLELLAANELRPALPEQAFAIVRPQLAQEVAGERQSPDYLAARALAKALLPQDDPGLREVTPESVSSLKLQDVKDYYAKVFRPDMAYIVVVGKIDPAAARTAVEKNFGSWTSQGPKPETELPPLPPNPPGTVNVPDSSRIQDGVVLAQTLGLTRSDPDYYALQVGNHVLGGGFYATRLYRDLREETGLVYYVASSFEIGKTRSFYKVSYGCDPGNVARARSIIVRDLQDMQDKLVPDADLTQAKAMLLREIPLGESSVGTIALGLLGRAVEGLPLDEPTLAARKYMAIDAKQVQAAFAKWLRPLDLVEVTQGPAAK